jgi:hypothetical protein
MAWQPRPPERDNDLAVAGLCCSLTSLGLLVIGAPFTLGFSMLLSGPLGIAGLVFGLLGRQKAERGEAGGRSMAQAAFVLGIVTLVLHVVVVIVGAVLIGLLIDALKDLDLESPDGPGPDTSPPA